MKYLAIIAIFILSSCIGSNDRATKPLNDLISDGNFKKEIKNQIKKEKKSLLKKNVIKKKKKVSSRIKKLKKSKVVKKNKKTKIKKKEANKTKVLNKKYTSNESKKKVVKSMKKDKNVDIYKVKNINEYEEYLRVYSENSDYPNINN